MDLVEKVIAAERPSAILPTVGGQTALNLAVALAESGVLARYGVQLIGADLHAIRVAEDRSRFKQAMEAAGRCVYAVTFGNFHGDNYSQAIGVANAISRVRQIHKRSDGTAPKVDVLAWSKGVLAVDAYLGNAAAWPTIGSRFFDRVASAQSDAVPSFRSDVRVYVALSGPHLGIDLNFRHPIHTLSIASTSWNAPVGRGPMPWTWFSALQCVNWGPDVPWYDNPYAKSGCESRGGHWPGFFGIGLATPPALTATRLGGGETRAPRRGAPVPFTPLPLPARGVVAGLVVGVQL